MIAEDYMPSFLFDEHEAADDEGIVCKHCGVALLEWREVRIEHNRKAWRLFDQADTQHECRSPEATADDFPAVS